VTWFDGELDPTKQRAAIERMASQQWDFAPIQANNINTLTEPVQNDRCRIPVITMDTRIASRNEIHAYSHIGADNEGMGAAITQALVTKLSGRGKIIMTQGPHGHTSAQNRTKGSEPVVRNYSDIEVLDAQPSDWDVTKVTRLWEAYLAKYPLIDAAFFHSDEKARQLLNSAVTAIRDMREKTGMPDLRTAGDPVIDLQTTAVALGWAVDDQIKAALLDAAAMIRDLHIVLDTGTEIRIGEVSRPRD
jgi:ABC-type sugar transport system substrate-binding protein